GFRDQEYNQPADNQTEDAVIGRANPTQKKGEHSNQQHLSEWGVGQNKEQNRGQDKAGIGSQQAKRAAAQGGGEIRLQNDRDGHGQPIRTLPADAPANRIRDSNTYGQANGMPEYRRTQIEARSQGGQPAGKLELPGRSEFMPGELLHTRRCRMTGKLHNQAQLSSQNIDGQCNIGRQRSGFLFLAGLHRLHQTMQSGNQFVLIGTGRTAQQAKSYSTQQHGGYFQNFVESLRTEL